MQDHDHKHYFAIAKNVFPRLHPATNAVKFQQMHCQVNSFAEIRGQFPFPSQLIHGIPQPYNFGGAQPGDSVFPWAFLNHYKEIRDKTTLKYQLKIHTSTFRWLTEAMKEESNQTSQHQENGGFFIYEKCTLVLKASRVKMAL